MNVQLQKQNTTVQGPIQTANNGRSRGTKVDRAQDKAFWGSFDMTSDSNYITKDDQRELNLPIKEYSTKEVFVANGSVMQGKHATKLPLKGLSPEARVEYSFIFFHSTLISSSKVVDDGNTAILDRQGVKVYKDEDVLILVKGKPVMIGKRDSHRQFKNR